VQELHLQLSADEPGFELFELQRLEPCELQNRGTDPGVREDQTDEKAERIPGSEPDRVTHRDAAAFAARAGKVRLPGRAQVFLPGLESESVSLPFLGETDVQHL